MSLPGAHLLRMPAPVRRKLIFACLSISALALVLTGTALADVGRGVPRADSPNAEGIQDLYWVVLAVTGVIFVIVEGALILFVVRFRNRGRARERGRPADPRPHAARADLDRDPGADPRGDHRRRLLQAARDPGRARGGRGRPEDDRPRRGPAVLLALHVPERRGLDQPARRPGATPDLPRRHGAVVRRDPQLVGAAARGQDGRDPGQGEPHLVRGATTRRSTRGSAPSSAGSSTR